MKNKKYVLTIIIGLAFFITIAYNIMSFNTTVNYELEKSVKTTLSDMANQQQLSLDRQLENMVYSIEDMARTLSIIGEDEAHILEYVKERQEELNIEILYMVRTNGEAFHSGGKLVDASNEEYFKTAMAGEAYASSPFVSEHSGKEVILFAVPIYIDGKIDGVLAVEYCTDYLRTLLASFTDDRGLNLIVDGNSNIILSTNEFVLSFEAFKNAVFEDGETFDSVVENFSSGKSGSLTYTLNGVSKFGEYRPIEINDWVLFFEISEESIAGSVVNISGQMLVISILIIVFGIVAAGYIVISKNRSAKELEKVAYYDEMTGIPNLIKFKMLVSDIVRKNPTKLYTMVKMDTVNFKAVNDMFGFEAGNKVICAIADTGKRVKNESFVQARVSAEEFMLFGEKELFDNLKESSKDYEKQFISMLPELAEHKFTFRYGRYFLKPGEDDMNDVVHKTSLVHSFAKKNTGTNVWDYDETFKNKILKEAEIENKMHSALANGEFKAYLQPKCSVASGKAVGAEALVRWIEPNGSMYYPNDFIPLFERNGFIVELDKYMLKSVCETMKKWRDQGKELLPISVNFSRLHIENENFVSEVNDIVASYGIEPNYIEIELTESTVIENEHKLPDILNKLHKKGFLVSIDDFGSGYSSLGMLKNFKVNTLKLDRSFFIDVNDKNEHDRGDKIIKSIVELANSLGMYTVAEGIEEKEQLDFLEEIKCGAAQGYCFAKPMSIEEFEARYMS